MSARASSSPRPPRRSSCRRSRAVPGRGRAGARQALRARRAARRAGARVRHRRVVRADRRQRALRRADGRAARAVGPGRPGEDRPRRRPTSPRPATSTTSTSPATRSIRAATTSAGGAASRRARRRPSTRTSPRTPADPGQARAPVLVLLRLQRLEQHARGRLGDDPARLRRGARRPRRSPARRRPSATASTRAPSGRRGTTPSSTLVGGTHPVVHPAAGSHANFFGEALYLGSSASEGVGCDDTRGPTLDAPPDRRHDPERSRGGPPGVPLDRVRAAAGASCSRRSSTARPGRT